VTALGPFHRQAVSNLCLGFDPHASPSSSSGSRDAVSTLSGRTQALSGQLSDDHAVEADAFDGLRFLWPFDALAFASGSSCAAQGVGPPLRSAYRPYRSASGPVGLPSSAQASCDRAGALSTPWTMGLSWSASRLRPASPALSGQRLPLLSGQSHDLPPASHRRHLSPSPPVASDARCQTRQAGAGHRAQAWATPSTFVNSDRCGHSHSCDLVSHSMRDFERVATGTYPLPAAHSCTLSPARPSAHDCPRFRSPSGARLSSRDSRA
jgi:hypothetical protein